MGSRGAWQASVMTAVIASAGMYVPAAIAGSTPSEAQLAHLVKQQSKQIQRLNARINKLEQEEGHQNHSSSASSTTAQNKPSKANLAKRVSKLEKSEKSNVKVNWSNGAPELSSPNGHYTFGIGGRIQYDFSGTMGSHYNSRNIQGSDFRRIRLNAHGKIAGWLSYKSELDFAGNSVHIHDMYVAAQKQFALGTGVVHIGSTFADSGLDGRTSSKWIWFVERNTVAKAIDFQPGAYNIGLSTAFYGKHHDHISFAVSDGSAGATAAHTSSNVVLRSRAHWDPIDIRNALLPGRTILHVGANGYYENYNKNHQFSDNTIIADHYNGNLRVSGPTLNAKSSTAYGFELAGLTGPFAADAEYGRLNVNARKGSNTHIDAYSAQVGVSLTGEQFGYSTKQGVWTRPDIKNPVTEGGIGDWELMARYQAINAHHDQIDGGGTGHGTTVGLSWFPNNYLRVMLDDTVWHTNNHSGYYIGHDNGNTITARTQIAF